MHPNEQLINRFYRAFREMDAATMAECYHPEAVFNDPAFQNLRGPEIGQMWAMLIERSRGELDIRHAKVSANDVVGQADWEAYYVFSKSKRPVHNRIHASFEFQEGKIIRHTDQFNFWKWSRMALGLPGYLLGWSSFLQNKVREQARKGLDKYIEEQAK